MRGNVKRVVAGMLIAGVIVGGAYWRSQQHDDEFQAVPTAAPLVLRPVESPPMPSPPASVVETILLLPELEIAAMPEFVSAEPLPRPVGDASPQKTGAAPRPEAHTNDRPWMPYAPEDRELSETRRLAWVTASVREAQATGRARDLEETQEPPLLHRESK